MAERRVTRNAWSKNKSSLAYQRKEVDPDLLSDDEIEIDLSEQTETDSTAPKPKNQKQRGRKKTTSLKKMFSKFFPEGLKSIQQETNSPSEKVAEMQIAASDESSEVQKSVDEAICEDERQEETHEKEAVDVSEALESQMDFSEFGHFLAPVGICDPRTIWLIKPHKKQVQNPAKKRLEQLKRVVKRKQEEDQKKKSISEEPVKFQHDGSVPAEKRIKGAADGDVPYVKRKNRKGVFRSNIVLSRYYRKDFSTYQEVVDHVAQLEEEHGVKWNKMGNSLDFKLTLEEYVEKYADRITQRQRLVYSANTAFPIEYFGHPYIVIEESIHLCEFGMGRKYKYETKKKDLGEPGVDVVVRQRTKKMCCSAEVCVRKILVFRKIKIPENSEYQRNLASRKIREILKGWAAMGKNVDLLKRTVGAEMLYICWSPKEEAHDIAHPMKDQRIKPVHPQVLAYIRQMTENGVTIGSQMEKCVDSFVRQNFPEALLPENLGKRPYWPEMKKIRNVIESWIVKKKITRIPFRRGVAPRPGPPKRPYKRRVPYDPTKHHKRRKKDQGAINVTGDVWLDEFGELVYSLDDYQANEVVVTTDGQNSGQNENIVEANEFEEYSYYEHEGEVIEDEYVITEELPTEELVEASEEPEAEQLYDATERPVALEILNAESSSRNPKVYEERLSEAQNTIRSLVRKLTDLSYNVGELTALEFAQRYIVDAIELLEEHVDSDMDSQGDVENVVPPSDMQENEMGADEVVWVSIDNHSNEMKAIEPPTAKKKPMKIRISEKRVPLEEVGYTDTMEGQYTDVVEYEDNSVVETPRTLKVISLPPPTRQRNPVPELPYQMSSHEL